MFDAMVYISNMAGGFAIGLWCVEFLILKKAKENNELTSDATKKKLKFCSFAKYFLILFVVMKVLLFFLY